MALNEPGEHNDPRVTNATLLLELRHLTDLMKDHAKRDERIWETYGARLGSLEIGQTQRQEQIGTLKSEVDRLRVKSDTWNILNSLGAVIAGVFAGLGWGK